jgi:hypothetical protein
VYISIFLKGISSIFTLPAFVKYSFSKKESFLPLLFTKISSKGQKVSYFLPKVAYFLPKIACFWYKVSFVHSFSLPSITFPKILTTLILPKLIIFAKPLPKFT